MYRAEAAVASINKLSLAEDEKQDGSNQSNNTAFVVSGNGIYPNDPQITLANIHDNANPLCCALSLDDTILATGGADKCVRLLQWGPAWVEESAIDAAAKNVVEKAGTLSFSAPVICVSFSPSSMNVLAAGCMDGSVQLVEYAAPSLSNEQTWQLLATPIPSEWKHHKYVRCMAWMARNSSNQALLATASADGNVHLYQITKKEDIMECDDAPTSKLEIQQLQTLHLGGSIEAMVFWKEYLLVYARNSPFLQYFDVTKDMHLHQKVNLNTNTTGKSTTGGFDDHVSFCIMDLAVSPCGTYLAAATDTSRNMVLEAATGVQLRNLYGHSNDGFSQPKLTWSNNGMYIIGNTQEEAALCVWDIASEKLITRLSSGTSSPVRDLVRGHSSDCVVTTSFDKLTKLWFPKA